MNITPLYELKDRLRTASIAGTSLLSEDFRLKKAAENFKVIESASPVFNKISKQTDELLSDKCGDKAGTLLDTIILVDMVICTLGATDAGEISDISGDFTDTAIRDVPYSQIGPLIEALEKKGGKAEVIQAAWKETPEIFGDYRAMSALVKGLGSSNAFLADCVQEIVSNIGAAILPLLKKGFDPKGKKEMVRRIRAIEGNAEKNGLDESAFFLEQLDNSVKDVRTALIYALRHHEENIDKLIELAKTEKAAQRKAAINALALLKCDKPMAFFEEYAGKKPEDVLEIISKASSEWTSRFTVKLIDDLLVDKDGNKVSFEDFLNCKAKLKCGADRFEITYALKGKTGAEVEDIYRQSNSEWNNILSQILGNTIILTGDEGLKKLALELNGTSPAKGTYIYAEGVVRLIGKEDCSEWLCNEIHEEYKRSGGDHNKIARSDILKLLNMIVVLDGKFYLDCRREDEISEGWLYNAPVPLDQPITGAIADAMMKYPCWQFDGILENWVRKCDRDEDFITRIIQHFSLREDTTCGLGRIELLAANLGRCKTKGLILNCCKSHKIDSSQVRGLVDAFYGEEPDNEFFYNEVREVIALLRKGEVKLNGTPDIDYLEKWNEKKYGGK